MSKFCGNCGAQLDDNALVCGNCGASLPQQKPEKGKISLNGILDSIKKIDFKNLDFKKVLPIIGGALVVFILIISLIFGGGYKGAVKKYIKAYEKSDAKKLMSVTSEIYTSGLEENFGDDFDVEDYYDEIVSKRMDVLEEQFGDDIKISYKIVENEKIDRDDLDDLKEFVEERDSDIKITKGYNLELEVTIEGSDDKETDEMNLIVLKENGKWKVSDRF